MVEHNSDPSRAVRDPDATADERARTFDAWFGAAADYICVVNRDVRFLCANRKLEELWGLTREDYAGRTPGELGYPPDLEATFSHDVGHVFANNQPVSGQVGFASARVLHSYEYVLSPILGPDGSVDLVLGVFRDVTEEPSGAPDGPAHGDRPQPDKSDRQQAVRRDLEDALRDRHLEVERESRAKDEFMAMLSHELRNPLAAMITSLETMRVRGYHTEEQDVLERQTRHLIRMVNDLSDLTRVAQGRLELQRTRVALTDVVKRALELASPTLAARDNHVETHVQDHGVSLDIDLDRMAQVLANLLTNASTYSEPRARIVVKGYRSGQRARLIVEDEGIGIAPEMLTSVFDAFVRHPDSAKRARGGLGLGLAVVRTLVTVHGGLVWAESRGVGHGSRFLIDLPAFDPAGDTPAPA